MLTDAANATLLPLVILTGAAAYLYAEVFRLRKSRRAIKEKFEDAVRRLERSQSIDLHDNDSLSSCVIAGIIMQLRGCVFDENADYDVHVLHLFGKTNFVTEGAAGENMRIRLKDGQDSRAVPVRSCTTIGDIRVHVLDEVDAYRGYVSTETRPSGMPYISVMPEGHPELETFFIEKRTTP